MILCCLILLTVNDAINVRSAYYLQCVSGKSAKTVSRACALPVLSLVLTARIFHESKNQAPSTYNPACIPQRFDHRCHDGAGNDESHGFVRRPDRRACRHSHTACGPAVQEKHPPCSEQSPERRIYRSFAKRNIAGVCQLQSVIAATLRIDQDDLLSTCSLCSHANSIKLFLD